MESDYDWGEWDDFDDDEDCDICLRPIDKCVCEYK